MKRRILSFILLLTLLVGILPAPAMAAGDNKAVSLGFSSFKKSIDQFFSGGSAWKDNVMRKDTASKTGGNVLGSKIQRSKIKTVTFLSSLTSAPDDSWDVSEAKDGSVQAWVKKNGSLYDLYIGASGGVCAPENCSGLFCGYTEMTKINFGYNFHTDNATTMSYMFSHCNSLEELDVSRFKTENVTRMECMFMHCYELDELDLSGFDVTNVTDMGSMFWKCTDLMRLYMPELGYKKGRNTAYMFEKCDKNMVVTYGESPKKSASNPTTAPATEPAPTTSSKPSKLGELPPTMDSLYSKLSLEKEVTNDNGYGGLMYSGVTSAYDITKTCEAYVKELEDYGYTLIDSEVILDTYYVYWLDCSDTSLEVMNYRDQDCRLALEGFALSKNVNRIYVYYSPTISGNYGSGGNSDNGGGGSSGGGTSPSPLPTLVTKCYKCHGNKTVSCTNCDGKGYTEEQVSVPNYSGSKSGSKYKIVKHDCYKCVGGSMTCPACHGSGKN